jgi:hypothetical protein
VLNSITAADPDAIAAARGAARVVAWAQRAEQTGHALPASLVAGTPLLGDRDRPVVVIDDDATIVVTHSEKEQTAATFKRSYGYHPVLAFCDNSNELPCSPRSMSNVHPACYSSPPLGASMTRSSEMNSVTTIRPMTSSPGLNAAAKDPRPRSGWLPRPRGREGPAAQPSIARALGLSSARRRQPLRVADLDSASDRVPVTDAGVDDHRLTAS